MAGFNVMREQTYKHIHKQTDMNKSNHRFGLLFLFKISLMRDTVLLNFIMVEVYIKTPMLEQMTRRADG